MTDSRYERRCTRLALALFGLATALAVLAVPWAAYVAWVHRESVLLSAFNKADSFIFTESALRYRRFTQCAGLLAVVSWPMISGLWLLVGWKQDRERVKRLLPTLAVAILPLAGLLVLAAGIAASYGAFGHLHNGEGLTFAEMTRERYLAMLGNLGLSPEIWSATMATVGVLALAGVVATNVLARQRYQRSQLAASAVTLTLGLAAYIATRAHADDAARPLPLWRPELQVPVFDVPAIQACGAEAASLESGVPLRVEATGEIFDGGSKVEDLASLAVVLRGRFEVSRYLSLRRPVVARVLVFAPPELQLETLGPVLSTARSAGALEFLAARSLPPQSWETRTIGTIRYSQRTCAIPFDPGALPKTGTWGEWAAKAEARRPRAAR